MHRRTRGALVVATGLLLWGVLLVALPHPTPTHSQRDRFDAGPVDADEVRLVSWGGVAAHYNGTRDMTFVLVAYCGSHRLCGPGVWMEGDLREGRLPKGPWILTPTEDGPLGLERVEGLGLPPGPADQGYDLAYTIPFKANSAWPPFLAYALAFLLVLVGATQLMPLLDARQSYVAAAFATLGVLAGVATDTGLSWALLLPLGLAVLGGLVGAATALVSLAFRKARGFAVGLSIVLLCLSWSYTVLALKERYFPLSGAGD